MRRKVLTRFEARLVERLAMTMFPKEGPIAVDAVDARVVDYVDTYLTWMPKQERALIRVMFLVFGLTAPRTPWRRKEWLEGWEQSRLYPRRVIFQALRSVLTLAYTSDPEVLRQMGVEDGTVILNRMREMQEQLDAWESRDIAVNEGRLS
jgi:hypothetical protein